MTEDDVLAFVQSSIKSVWALEVLLLLRRERRGWHTTELVRELRSSDAAVSEALHGLRNAGLAVTGGSDLYRYEPASGHLDDIAARIESIYAAKPLAVVKVIMRTPSDKLRIFANAFKLKD